MADEIKYDHTKVSQRAQWIWELYRLGIKCANNGGTISTTDSNREQWLINKLADGDANDYAYLRIMVSDMLDADVQNELRAGKHELVRKGRKAGGK